MSPVRKGIDRSGLLDDDSSAGFAYGRAGRGVHAIRFPVDELFVDEGDKRKVYSEDVGHVLGQSHIPYYSMDRGRTDNYDVASLSLNKAEGTDAFSQFHLYVCSAFLVKWSKKLQEMDFQVRVSRSLLSTSPG